jgi:NAD(P)-dependent dehydrogenase (short-subunit alcohol dehydrogenase family)
MPKTIADLFALNGAVVVITGGAGLLGAKHAEAIALAGGLPVLLDIAGAAAEKAAARIASQCGVPARAFQADITQPGDVQAVTARIESQVGPIGILINNAANNPKAEAVGQVPWSRFEQFSMDQWQADLAVGLTGAFLCSQAIGSAMAQRGHGVILNVASDLAVIAPDQRLYRQAGLPDDQQPVKPVTYSVVKTGLIGLTRYLATYWANRGVRVNAISPGGVYNGQPDDFVRRLSDLIPLGRMANADEYQAAIIFMCSDASAYMNGTNLIIDGGRTVW